MKGVIQGMASYSIKDLENFTSIKAHTIRIWEQRYKLLEPRRTETNIRYYTDEDLKKILNISLLYNNGLKISKIARLDEAEIYSKAREILHSEKQSSSEEIESIVRAISDLNENFISGALHRLYDEIGMERLFAEVLVPLLERVGVLWQVNTITVSHEHFFSNILREFLIVKIDGIRTRDYSKPRIVLFLAEHEKHEISLLFYYYILKSRGYECYYLGQSVPHKDLIEFVKKVKPEYLFSSLVAELLEENFDHIMNELEEIFDMERVYIGGIQMKNFESRLPEKINSIQAISDITLK